MSTEKAKAQPMKTLDLATAGSKAGRIPQKTEIAWGDRDEILTIKDKVDEQTQKSRHTFLSEMDAIAYGIEAWYELASGYSKRITERTVAIARKLGVPEDEIEKWVASRYGGNGEGVKIIKSLLERL